MEIQEIKVKVKFPHCTQVLVFERCTTAIYKRIKPYYGVNLESLKDYANLGVNSLTAIAKVCKHLNKALC